MTGVTPGQRKRHLRNVGAQLAAYVLIEPKLARIVVSLTHSEHPVPLHLCRAGFASFPISDRDTLNTVP
jgi:hypothetical protein